MPKGSAPGQDASAGSSSSNKEYNRQLTALNYSVRDWITKHVNDNPLCDLNPIFRDYERHLATIESKYGSSATAGEQQPGKQTNSISASLSLSSSTFSSIGDAASAAPALFSFTKNKDEASPEKSSTPAGITFNFGKKVDSSVLNSLGSTGAHGFSFSPSSTPLFGGVTGAGASASTLSFNPTQTETASNSQAAGIHSFFGFVRFFVYSWFNLINNFICFGHRTYYGNY